MALPRNCDLIHGLTDKFNTVVEFDSDRWGFFCCDHILRRTRHFGWFSRWSTFVVPRLLYGLESILLSKKDVECLEKFQRKCLKQIQGLPDKTDISISLALLGVLPLDAVVHKNALSTF